MGLFGQNSHVDIAVETFVARAGVAESIDRPWIGELSFDRRKYVIVF